MRREVSKSRKLPSFALSLAELKILCDKVLANFEADKVYFSLEVKFNSEKITFESVEELAEYSSNLPNKIQSFNIWIMESESDKIVNIGSYHSFKAYGEVTADSDSEAWCAGVIEEVCTYLETHKLWYNWLNKAPLGYLIFIIINSPFLLLSSGKLEDISNQSIIGWTVALLTVSFLYAFRGRLFPHMVLRVTDDEGFVRKHSPTIALVFGLLSLIITAYGVFKS